ncbi:phenylacetic acid degradation operon negative regulatory protein [Microbacterium foliorum]|uniref:Phenylacetic acid degradation operon negative regulatory protein n=1 Tax=Microbacterium foliorum TaxID=104336 RepID=A0ABU1HSV8_9MICO|nr:PaaX family transcriptional regulator C-terminal domain-containing protein [Microbacterium foliorum]MDR6142733.1 phenylacetic acid degradation operon negative regulatory protein [Microbacterium foliorum]
MTAEPTEQIAAGPVLDDIDARPGSTASLLRTLVGLYLRPLGDWISAADLVALAGDLGIATAQARTGVTRLKQKGLLLAERRHAVGYRLNPDAATMLERGDRRIFEMREMTDADSWCLISFSMPESARATRHQLRRRLQWIGAGVVSPALWICPGHLQGEVLEIVDDLDAREWVTLFQAGTPTTAHTLPEAAADWWDLDALRAEHLEFQSSLETLPEAPFAAYVQLIDRWRVLPYIDPGLPPSMLPADWPGRRSIAEFLRLSTELSDAAWQRVREVTRAEVTGAEATGAEATRAQVTGAGRS